MTDTLWSTILDFGESPGATEPEIGPVPDSRLEYCPIPIAIDTPFRIIVSGDSAFFLQWPYGGLSVLDSVVRTYTQVITLSGSLEVNPEYPVHSITSITAIGPIVRKDEVGVLHEHADVGGTLSAQPKLGKIVFKELYYGLVEAIYSVYFKRYEHSGVSIASPYYVNVVYPAPLIVNGEITGHKNIYTTNAVPVGGFPADGIIEGDAYLCDGLEV